MIFPGFVHAVEPTPVKLAPVPALFGPLVNPVISIHEEVTDKDPEPPGQIATPLVVGAELTVIVPVAFTVPQPTVNGIV